MKQLDSNFCALVVDGIGQFFKPGYIFIVCHGVLKGQVLSRGVHICNAGYNQTDPAMGKCVEHPELSFRDMTTPLG